MLLSKIVIKNFIPSSKQIQKLSSICSNIEYDKIIEFKDRKSFVYIITAKTDNHLFFKIGNRIIKYKV